MVPWSQLRQPFLGWLRTDLTTEFTHFNLVIHLSKVQQTALSLSAFSTSRRPCCLCDTFDRPFLPEWCRSEQSETSFSRCSPSFYRVSWHDPWQATGMSFSCRCGHFGFWWGWTFRASNSTELMPLRRDLTTVPAGSNARLFRFELSPP